MDIETSKLPQFPIQQTFPDHGTAEPPKTEPAKPAGKKKAGGKTGAKAQAKGNGTKTPAEAQPAAKVATRPKAKRRARATMPSTTVEVAVKPKRGRPAGPRETSVPLSALPVLTGLKDDELQAVLQFVDQARQTFGKKARNRVAAAIGRLLGT